eukprot:gb/GECG01001165.1/.p1 GENE.gb/GECG01001165.1/~~gb/GECG01001165.1/.p1  ORF type:complete len:154 (+),score=23.33 gb/GECG01001165.1/:1-462(+)
MKASQLLTKRNTATKGLRCLNTVCAPRDFQSRTLISRSRCSLWTSRQLEPPPNKTPSLGIGSFQAAFLTTGQSNEDGKHSDRSSGNESGKKHEQDPKNGGGDDEGQHTQSEEKLKGSQVEFYSGIVGMLVLTAALVDYYTRKHERVPGDERSH